MVFFISACGVAISEDVVNPAPHPMQPRTPDQVEIFTAGAPARPHVDVAVYRAVVSGPTTNDDRIAKLRETAAQRGCDGLVLANTDAGWAGTCIVYK